MMIIRSNRLPTIGKPIYLPYRIRSSPVGSSEYVRVRLEGRNVVHHNWQDYYVDFVKMVQRNVKTGATNRGRILQLDPKHVTKCCNDTAILAFQIHQTQWWGIPIIAIWIPCWI